MNRNRCPGGAWVLPAFVATSIACSICPHLLWFVLPLVGVTLTALISCLIYGAVEAHFNSELKHQYAWFLRPIGKFFAVPFWVLGIGLVCIFLSLGFWWH